MYSDKKRLQLHFKPCLKPWSYCWISLVRCCPWFWSVPNDCPSSERTHSATQWPKREEYIKVWLVCEGRESPHSLNSSWTLLEPPLCQGETKTGREKERLGGRDMRPPFPQLHAPPWWSRGRERGKEGEENSAKLHRSLFPLLFIQRVFSSKHAA